MNSSPERTRRSVVLRGADADRILSGFPVLDITESVPVQFLADRVAAGAGAGEHARRSGFDEGYQEGFDRGVADGRDSAERAAADHAARTASLSAALSVALERAELAYRNALNVIEGQLASAAFDLTEAILQRELELAASSGRDAIARALKLAPGRVPVVAHLHPDDAAMLANEANLGFGREVAVVADPGVLVGDCLLEVGSSEIDASLGAALLRVREALGVTG